MIVHVFNGRQKQLVPSIAKGFISFYSDIAKPYIVIIGGSYENRKSYLDLFESNGFKDYEFIHSFRQFVKYDRTIRRAPILFHGGNYEWFLAALLSGSRNVNWLCWGAGAAIGNNWKSRMMTPIKRYIYQHFRTIVTLMDEDKTTIVRDFHVRPENIQTIPYASAGNKDTYGSLFRQLLEEQPSSQEKPLVLLGNSPHEMKNYIEMLPRLSHLKGKIRVQCMNNYTLKRDGLYNQLIETGREYFGDDFKSNEDFHSDREDYICYMNTCDVYVCSCLKQTGLGAIGTCLRLGKKIYIHGKNLSWMRNHYGVMVHDTDEITDKIDADTLLKPLTLEEKRFNHDAILNKRSAHVELWNNYLRVIDNANAEKK